MAERKVAIDHLMYVRYRHTDIKQTHKFLLDFGFIVVQEEKDRILYRGFGQDPVSYISEQTDDGKALFLGGGWAVNSYLDLELATKLPGASAIVEADKSIGGKTVSLKDPAGGPMYLHFGYSKRSKDQIEKPETLTFNTWDNKRRLGEFQRLPDGPSHIHKLGHYGFEVNHADFEKVREFYFGKFNLEPTDSLFDPNTKKDIMVFAHVDKGEDYTDHHVSGP